MSIVSSIETIRKWLEDNVCNQVKLKLPDDEAVDASFPYTLVNPASFAMFVPSKDRLIPPAIAPIPSVCVQLVEGQDNTIDNHRTIKVRLYFSAWDPGLHGMDYFIPKGDGTYSQWNDAEAFEYFKKNGEGWRDAWNFVDTAIRVIENNDYMNGLRIMKEEGIKFGTMKEQEAVPDYYPYWFAWIELSIGENLTRYTKEYEHLL